MFARTQSFDGLLYVQAEGMNARGLQTHLRLFVNRLRSGKFINSCMIKVSQSVDCYLVMFLVIIIFTIDLLTLIAIA